MSKKRKGGDRPSNGFLADELEAAAASHPDAGAQALLCAAAQRLRDVPAPTLEFEPALILDGTAHVLRNGKLHVVKGGVLVRDTDLTEREIDELTAQRFVRFATSEELARLRAPDPDAEDGE